MGVLHANGFQALLVGGCVRDSILGRQPNDWDVITDAVPDQIQSLFDKTVAVGAAFGTVVVCTPEPVEVTTFRRDADYLDKRRPSGVFFSSSVHEDLALRDFTMNAIAWDFVSERLIDPLRRTIRSSQGDHSRRRRSPSQIQ